MTDRAYARISLDTLVSGSITRQRSRLARYADDEPEWYVDESVSGSKIPFAQRPEGRRLLADLVRGDRVLVTKIDRAARNVRDLLGLVEEIEARGASIVFVEQNIDTAGPMGRFLLTLLGAIAELEAGIIAERRRESLAAFREEGRHAQGRAPHGLRSVPNPNGRGLVLRPDPETAPRLREAVERLYRGEPQHVLADFVGLSPGAFSRLLRNTRLAGIQGVGSSLRVDPDQAVFSSVEWQRLQDFLGRPEKAWTKADGYGAALRCAVCDRRLYLNVASEPRLHRYRCRRVNGHERGEPISSVSRYLADAKVEADFLGRFGHLPVTDRVIQGSSEARDEAVAQARLHLDAIRAQQDQADTEAEEEILFQAYLSAKRALREAEALPAEAVEVEVLTGETLAQAWHAADDTTRTSLLLRVGPWIVEPGRLPIEQKVHLDEALQDYLAGQV